jgi:hypothetical protein
VGAREWPQTSGPGPKPSVAGRRAAVAQRERPRRDRARAETRHGAVIRKGERLSENEIHTRGLRSQPPTPQTNASNESPLSPLRNMMLTLFIPCHT